MTDEREYFGMIDERGYFGNQDENVTPRNVKSRFEGQRIEDPNARYEENTQLQKSAEQIIDDQLEAKQARIRELITLAQNEAEKMEALKKMQAQINEGIQRIKNGEREVTIDLDPKIFNTAMIKKILGQKRSDSYSVNIEIRKPTFTEPAEYEKRDVFLDLDPRDERSVIDISKLTYPDDLIITFIHHDAPSKFAGIATIEIAVVNDEDDAQGEKAGVYLQADFGDHARLEDWYIGMTKEPNTLGEDPHYGNYEPLTVTLVGRDMIKRPNQSQE